MLKPARSGRNELLDEHEQSLRVNNVTPCDTTWPPHHQPIRELCTSWSHTLGRPSLTLSLKMLCWNLLGSLGVSSTSLVPGGLPWWLSGKEPTCQCRRCRSNPWVRKIPWRRKWQPIPVFLPGKSHGQRSLVGYLHEVTKSWTWLSDWTTATNSE